MWRDGDKLVKQDDQSARFVAEVASAQGAPTMEVGHMIHHVACAMVAAAVLRLADQAAEPVAAFA